MVLLDAYLPSDYLPVVVQLGLALAFVVVTMLVTHSIGPKIKGKVKDEQWECGIESVGDARATRILTNWM